MTNTPDSDDVYLAGIGAMTEAERIDALLDVVNDTAQWQAEQQCDTDGRAR